MKALIYTGISEKTLDIVEKTKPEPQDGQVLIKMTASALNHRDQWMRVEKYPGMKANVTLGSDGCGVVEESGKNADPDFIEKEVIVNPNNDWGPNPRAQAIDYHILGMPLDGTFAEYLIVNEDRVHLKPTHLSPDQAAALPLGGLTAYRACFTHGGINGKSKVLITGIGGGVAQFALQFCLAVGAEVHVSSSSEEKINRATEIGASDGFNYKNDNWVKEATSKTGDFDVVIDSAGGDAINNYIKVMRPGGIIVFYGSTLGPSNGIDLRRMFWGQVRLQGSTMGNDEEFSQMLKFVEDKKIVPIVDSVRPFDEIITAMDEMERGTQMGKLVVRY